MTRKNLFSQIFYKGLQILKMALFGPDDPTNTTRTGQTKPNDISNIFFPCFHVIDASMKLELFALIFLFSKIKNRINGEPLLRCCRGGKRDMGNVCRLLTYHDCWTTLHSAIKTVTFFSPLFKYKRQLDSINIKIARRTCPFYFLP